MKIASLCGSDTTRKCSFRVSPPITDGDDDCHAENSQYYPATVVSALRRSGFDVHIDIVGFAIDKVSIADKLRELARLDGGTFYMAKDAAKLRRALRRSFNAPFEVQDWAGKLVARGTVGGPAIELPSGNFNAVVRTTGRNVTIEGIEIRNQQATRVILDKEGSQVTAGQPEIVANVPLDRDTGQEKALQRTTNGPQSSSSSTAAISTQDQVRRLLEEAEDHLAADRLTVPSETNAYKSYQDVLRLKPENNAAEAGIRQIANRYLALSKRASQRGDVGKAKGYAAKGLELSPRHAGLIGLHEALLNAATD